MSNGVGYTDMVIESRKMSKSVEHIRLTVIVIENHACWSNF